MEKIYAVVLPGDAEPFPGQIPTADMEAVLYPLEERMDVDPESPLMPKKSLK